MVWQCPQRFVVATIVLLGLAIQYINRVSFDVALTVMTHEVYQVQKKRVDDCPLNVTRTYNPSVKAEFYWTPHDQADLLGAFYIGYTITHLPGGVLSDSIGPKKVMGVGTFVCGVCALLTPVCARLTGTIGILMLNRIVMGLAQGPLFPSTLSFIARWSVPAERNIMCSYILMGINVGAVHSLFVTQYLLYYLDSWDTIFYLYGVLTLLFSVAWHLFVHDSPSRHPFIKEEERVMIVEGLKGEKTDRTTGLPLADILRSVPVWAMIIGHVGHDCNFYILMTLVPHYVEHVLHMDVMDYAVTSCGMYAVMFIFCISSTLFAGFVLKKGWLSKTNQCKVWLVVANVVPGAMFLLGSLSGCHRTLAVSCFFMAFAFLGFAGASIWVVNVDLSPNYAGLLEGLKNGFGCFLAILDPQVVAIFAGEERVSEWRIGFLITFCSVCLATLFFVVFGSSELQPWNNSTAVLPPEGQPPPSTPPTTTRAGAHKK